MTYSLDIDPTLNTEAIELPNMIIQPFVENAIWHGIMPLSTPGHISVIIQPGMNEILEIRIADNGIGKENAQKFQREMHQSKGIEMINERLRLLDEEQKQTIDFQVNTSSEDFPGTLVIIHLTKKMYRKKLKMDHNSFSLTQ
jgi:sensor histidine kinase YesM